MAPSLLDQDYVIGTGWSGWLHFHLWAFVDDSTAGPLSMWSLILQGYPRLAHMVVEEFPAAREATPKQLITFQASAGVKFPNVPLVKII